MKPAKPPFEVMPGLPVTTCPACGSKTFAYVSRSWSTGTVTIRDYGQRCPCGHEEVPPNALT